MRVRNILRCCIALSTSALTAFAAAQTYPVKPVRVLVGFTPGGSSDIVARLVAQKLSEAWGQPAVVENRPGAGANIAADVTAKSAPDGYTLLVTQNSIALSPSLYAKLPYDPRKDLVPIAPIERSGHILVVHPSLPARDVKQLIALMISRPGELTFSSSGVGINDHMAGELFRLLTHTNVLHVPYKGGAQAAGDVMAGQITYYFAGMPVGLPLYKQGRLKALAVTSRERYKNAPELPTMIEAGVPDYEVVLWHGFFAPAALDRRIVNKIASDVNRVQQDAEFVSKLDANGTTPFVGTPESFKAFYDSEYTKWAKVIKTAGIKIE